MNCLHSRRLLLAVFVIIIPDLMLFGAVPGDVVINEIAWMGTEASTFDEWIELYNTTSSDIDLSGWTLVSADGDPVIALSGTIPAGGFFLLERTDDNTVSDIPADLIYSGNLGNAGECLQLKDETDALIDGVDCSAGWFAGSGSPKGSMERKDPESGGSTADNWDTNNGITVNGQDASGGPMVATPGAPNSVFSGFSSVLDTRPAVAFGLISSYPNPFNPETVIRYTVPEGKGNRSVGLTIYSLLGVPVRRLVEGWVCSGTHPVRWDGRDDQGKAVVSGVYIVRFYLDDRTVGACRLILSK